MSRCPKPCRIRTLLCRGFPQHEGNERHPGQIVFHGLPGLYRVRRAMPFHPQPADHDDCGRRDGSRQQNGKTMDRQTAGRKRGGRTSPSHTAAPKDLRHARLSYEMPQRTQTDSGSSCAVPPVSGQPLLWSAAGPLARQHGVPGSAD